MANPEFSFIYNVTIRQYKNESLFNTLESDETNVLVLANGLREATDKAEDYAESMSQDGAYKFYDVVAVEELDTVYTGLSDPEDDYVENPDDPDFIPDPSTEPEKVSVEYHTSNPNEIMSSNLTEGDFVVEDSVQISFPSAGTYPVEIQHGKIPDHVGYNIFYVNNQTGEKIPAYLDWKPVGL